MTVDGTLGLRLDFSRVFRGTRRAVGDLEDGLPVGEIGQPRDPSPASTGTVADQDLALLTKQPRFLFLPDAAETRSELAVPLRTKTAVIGVLNIESDRLNAFDESDVAVLQSMAHQAAVAIENARLFRDTVRQVRELRALRLDPPLSEVITRLRAGEFVG